MVSLDRHYTGLFVVYKKPGVVIQNGLLCSMHD